MVKWTTNNWWVQDEYQCRSSQLRAPTLKYTIPTSPRNCQRHWETSMQSKLQQYAAAAEQWVSVPNESMPRAACVADVVPALIIATRRVRIPCCILTKLRGVMSLKDKMPRKSLKYSPRLSITECSESFSAVSVRASSTPFGDCLQRHPSIISLDVPMP